MDEDSTSWYIGITSVLLAILLILTFALATVVWYKSRKLSRNKIKRKKPRLKLNIKDVPKTRVHTPSAAYHMLSSKDPPEFTIPPTPTLTSPATPGSPRSQRHQTKSIITPSSNSKSTDDYVETPLASPLSTPKNSTTILPPDFLYRRSASVPNEVFFSRDKATQDLSSSALWRSAINKTVAASLLTRPLRGNRKVHYPTSGMIKFCLRYNPSTLEFFIKVKVLTLCTKANNNDILCDVQYSMLSIFLRVPFYIR